MAEEVKITQNTRLAPQLVDLSSELNSLTIAPIYFNGFTIAYSGSDFTIILKLDNKPVECLKASFTVAKTLAVSLEDTVERFEKATGHNLMTIHEADDKLKEYNKSKE